MSQPSKPDGTDPRIVVPDDDEDDVIVKSSFGGTGQAYHTCECRNVVQMESTRTVKQTIAEWKGYTECNVCITEGEYNDDPGREEIAAEDKVHPSPTREECAAFRTRILSGASPAQVAADTTWGRTAVYTHARGDCTHADPPAHAPVAYGWHVDTDADETGGSNKKLRVSAATCRTLRQQLIRGESRSDLTERHDISESAITEHVTGRCNHDADAHGHPPLAYGWHQVEE
jgi:hypothetical protein